MALKNGNDRESKIQKTISDATQKIQKEYSPKSTMTSQNFLNRTTPNIGVPIENNKKY